MTPIPLTRDKANAIVRSLHRHHGPVAGHLFAVGAEVDGRVIGCAIVGRPVSRHYDDGLTAEITRVATDGTRNACSFLYGRCRRIAELLGFRRLITYTSPTESGSSLRGAGFVCEGEAGGGTWSRESRKRTDKAPTVVKLRWSAKL